MVHLKCSNGHNLKVVDGQRRVVKSCCQEAYDLIDKSKAVAPAILRYEREKRDRRKRVRSA